MSLPLTQELLLIALDEESGRRHKTETIDYGLAGAALVELVLQHRVDVVDKKLVVTDPTPLGDAVIDELLAAVADKPRTPKAFVNKYRPRMSKKVGQQLADAGIVVHETKNFLGFIPSQRYVERNGIPEKEVRGRLTSVVLRGAPADERTAALAALIDATELTKQAFPDVPKRDVKAQLKELAEGDWGSEAVRKAISDMRGAVAAAAVAAGAAASST